MPTFIMTGTWTDQGIRGVKEAPKRAQAARDLAKKLDVEIKQAFLTSGESDLLSFWRHQTPTISLSLRWRSAP
jgi:uncharacterized protein with GYD domain